MKAVSDEDLWAHLWSVGDLSLLLSKGQQRFSSAYAESDSIKFVVCCSRRYGKSYWLCAEALSKACATPGAQLRYAAPTAKMVKSIVVPHMRNLLASCPADMRPQYRSQDGLWLFPNGSEIHVAGCDNGGADRLRGTSTDLALIDEAGFISDLDYLVQDILMPQTITTDGRIILASTPPRSASHDFRRYAVEAQAGGYYVHRSILDAPSEVPHITPAKIELYKKESGGGGTTKWRREYLAQFVTDSSYAVVPEFQDFMDQIVLPVEPDATLDKYVSVDVGFQDLTFAVFAQYNWAEGVVEVVGEEVMSNANSMEVDTAIAAKEAELWGDSPVHKRFADATEMTLADLSYRGRRYTLPPKHQKEKAVNNLRTQTELLGYKVDPSCQSLVSHLQNATWNASRTSFERSGQHGHFDGVDAMIYLMRCVDKQKKPGEDKKVVVGKMARRRKR